MRIAFVLAALAAATLPTAAQTVSVERIEVVDKGIYEIVAGAPTQSPNTPTGTITAVAAEKLVTATTAIPARVGLEFGFRYKIVGAPAAAEMPLDIVFTYPAPGLKDPAAASPSLESRFQRVKKIGETVYLGYGFEHDWEIVPGAWTFAVFHGGRKLAEEKFTVTKP